MTDKLSDMSQGYIFYQMSSHFVREFVHTFQAIRAEFQVVQKPVEKSGKFFMKILYTKRESGSK